ncbi:hypothetical protein HETIRDRAFT_382749 [Heterobasidion irregulare TC 32-1]|uniref:Protein kinase domain-containing protein n=1 Tax=Heterobasidion irregulare (strain TC 32-1) TaxID=747525 RepID=W4KAC0_HETIT|nr:uncharacterized protein HETIRDRAFT_382749 [Heterobasidion irregulare TC 32-1]ETW82699.1 hypothetical protein HETIRDRAFT_382749 [Heterobasidion irregulare TC 32-1]
MAHEFVGPMPVEDFFKAFMNPGRPYTEPSLPKQWRGKFRAKLIKKLGFENSFINAVNRAEICPDLVLVNTTKERDDQFWRKPDITVYKRPYNGPPTTDFERMELHIERKTASEDPFSDPKSRKSRQEHSFEHDSKASMKSRGQIISYTACQFASQHRCFTFSILFLDDHVRFIRWDRAGAIVTKRFNWRDDPKPLARFLWLFNHLSDAERGYDTSISKPAPREITLTKKKLDERANALARAKGEPSRLPETRYSTDDSFRKFCVVDDDPGIKEGEARVRFFVASVPQWQSGSPVGRGTKGYEALDLETGELVYLKDTWRYEADRMKKEGDTYRKLAANGVSHIPRVACAGDVEGQRTRTHDFTDEDWCCGEPEVRQHRHYRLVLKDLGRPLSEFNSTRELCQVLLEAIIAHMEAFKVDVLHQDISGGNILITDDGHALLIDWELAKRVSEEKSPRQDWRTGTWQFISTAILENPRKVHELRDDLESFLHVLLYHSVRYSRTSGRFFRSVIP